MPGGAAAGLGTCFNRGLAFQHMNASRQRLLLGAAIALWVTAIALGARELWHYSQTPGKLAATPERWPVAAGRHIKGKPAMVIFLHPECPCSRASVTELSRLIGRMPRDLSVTAYFLQLEGEAWSAENSSLWKSVSRLPGVKIVPDAHGQMARVFGAETSGTTLLYDAEGRLRFRGGITSGRGHEGENESEEALISSLRDMKPQPTSTNVFGCSLF